MDTINWVSLLFALLFLAIFVLAAVIRAKPKTWEGKAIGAVLFLIIVVLFVNVFCRITGEL